MTPTKTQACNSAAAEGLAQSTPEQARKQLSERGIAREKYPIALSRACEEGDTELIRLLEQRLEERDTFQGRLYRP